MRRIVPSLLLWGALALLALGGCESYRIELETSEIDLTPGEVKSVRVQNRSSAVCASTYHRVLPESVDVPKGKGVTVKVEGRTVVVSANEGAKPGTVLVTLKGGKAKDATLVVNVRPK